MLSLALRVESLILHTHSIRENFDSSRFDFTSQDLPCNVASDPIHLVGSSNEKASTMEFKSQ